MRLPVADLTLTRRQALKVLGAAGAVALGGCAAQQGSTAGQGAASAAGQDAGRGADQGDALADTDAGSDEPAAAPEPAPTTAEKLLASMTLEQKVAQMLFVTPEQLAGVELATKAGPLTQAGMADLPVGGVIYFSQNIKGDQQLRDMLSGTVKFSRASGVGIPVFTATDEEGGSLVARVANSGFFDVERFSNMWWIGQEGDPTRAAYVGNSIGFYLRDIGFTLDFAPVADVLTNPSNPVIGHRSFSSDPQVCAEMVAAEVQAMLATGMLPCAKHFPGHGDTRGDSHTGAVYSCRTADELHECEYLPFQAAVEAGCPFIMVGHIQTPNAAGDGLPATLSHIMIAEALRGRLGFTGVVISDSMSMGAISQNFEVGDAAARFVEAGGDMVLMSPDPWAARDGIIEAVTSGRLTEDRINESVARIIAAKQAAGLVEA
ncbi:glycoside hydrolase family 3 protein [Paratractidigestivibacter sp.]|uniref:glycoside hydrolase family 3 protein n=1 Tax=Paratractidigestivibacter sp. TaxID=2847316 RepID=UPI002AC9B48F|nr:glycoside hydrolase family 3 N-terminal domain-containing protein [Paratractidigestivibacter sp.]